MPGSYKPLLQSYFFDASACLPSAGFVGVGATAVSVAAAGVASGTDAAVAAAGTTGAATGAVTFCSILTGSIALGT